MLQAKGIVKSFRDLPILKGVDFSVSKGEVVSIVGPSGAGKSTLLHILGSLMRPDAGSVEIQGTPVFTLPANKLSQFRNQHIGFIFQFHHLLPEFTAFENICLPAMIARVPKASYEKKAMELLSFLGLTARKDHKPAELSGGEQQRTAVARALINQPAVVLADEPSGNLDSENAAQLNQLIFDLRKAFNQTFVIVTHNQQLAKISDRTVGMKDGIIQG